MALRSADGRRGVARHVEGAEVEVEGLKGLGAVDVLWGHEGHKEDLDGWKLDQQQAKLDEQDEGENGLRRGRRRRRRARRAPGLQGAPGHQGSPGLQGARGLRAPGFRQRVRGPEHGRGGAEAAAQGGCAEAGLRRVHLLSRDWPPPYHRHQRPLREPDAGRHRLQRALDFHRHGREPGGDAAGRATRLPDRGAHVLRVLRLRVDHALHVLQEEEGRDEGRLVCLRQLPRLHYGRRDVGDDGDSARHGRRGRHGQRVHPQNSAADEAVANGQDGAPVSGHAGAAHPDQGHGGRNPLRLLHAAAAEHVPLRVRHRLQAADSRHSHGEGVLLLRASLDAHPADQRRHPGRRRRRDQDHRK
mmetsp:Transcript_64665/g.189579  ORF Transcript_64665/g.189579 Transcript_64665/m.189579 type:complete len:358 (+) Transcript_64665:136-1209(+)